MDSLPPICMILETLLDVWRKYICGSTSYDFPMIMGDDDISRDAASNPNRRMLRMFLQNVLED